MSNIPSVSQKVQIEATQTRQAVSEALMQTMGGSINWLIDQAALFAGNNLKKQVFTSSTTWTVPADVNFVYVEGCGGGSGGNSAWGGNGAPKVSAWLDVIPSSTITVTVGAGGAGVAGYSTAAGDGTSSFFGLFQFIGGGWTGSNGYGVFSYKNHMPCWYWGDATTGKIFGATPSKSYLMPIRYAGPFPEYIPAACSGGGFAHETIPSYFPAQNGYGYSSGANLGGNGGLGGAGPYGAGGNSNAGAPGNGTGYGSGGGSGTSPLAGGNGAPGLVQVFYFSAY